MPVELSESAKKKLKAKKAAGGLGSAKGARAKRDQAMKDILRTVNTNSRGQ